MKNILRSFLFMGVCLFTVVGAQSAFALDPITCAGQTLVEGVDFATDDAVTLTGSGTCYIDVNEQESTGDAFVSMASLTINTGTILSNHVSGTTADYHNELDLHIAGTLTVDSGGSINVDGMGYLHGTAAYTEGNVANGSKDASGGSHGGKGGKPGSYDLADDYDSIKLPMLPGSGGGSSSNGGDGGGVIRITATTITLNDSISANGNSITNSYTGAGAGGTIYLNATTINLASGKTISANGGASSSNNNSGGGGGGRIALYYTTFNDSGTVQAYGGDTADPDYDGASGTIYHSHGGTEDLYIDSGTVVDDMQYDTEIDADNDETFDNVYLLNTARLLIESDATNFVTTVLKFSTGTIFESDVDMTFAKVDTTGLYPDGGTAIFDAGLTLSDGSAGFDTTSGDETGILVTNGNTYINSGSVVIGSGLVWEANSDTIERSDGIDLVDITVKSGGTLTTSDTTSSTVYDLELTLSGTLLLESGGSISVNEKGYLHGTPAYTDGNTTTGGSRDASGGSHGGRGGQPSTGYALSENYDSIELPTQPGGGGGSNSNGGDGGGVIIINAATITLNDNMTANGGSTSDSYTGSGAGGTVYLNATTINLDTDKVISANGGNATKNNTDGGGGGGRISILYTTFNNSGDVQAYGGNSGVSNGDGAAGTVFLHDQAETYGDLYVENCSTCAAPRFYTSLLTTIPSADQHGANSGYVFENTIVDSYGVLNIPVALDANGTGATDGSRRFFCPNCAEDGNGNDDDTIAADNGEIVYNVAEFSGGLTADYICVGTNATPTVSINSVVQKSDGSGYVDINIEVDDGDVGETITVKVGFGVAGACGGGGTDATLDSTITADLGTPTINNGVDYQVQGVSVVDAGSNTLDFDWLSATDASSGDETYCLVFTPNDGNGDGTPVIYNTLTIDNVAPSGLGTLSVSSHTDSAMTLGWTGTLVETNFDHYEIWYDTTQGNVTGRSGASEWDNGDDGNLATKTTATTSISLGPNVGNYYKIWAVDDYGNESTIADIQAYNSASDPGTPTVAANATTGLNSIIDQNSNPSSTEFAIKVGTNYVQANGALDTSAVWQTYATWGSGSGEDITGLSSNTQYAVSVKARNGDNDETSFSSTSSKYTFAGAVTGVALADATTDSAYGLTLTWTDADQDGLKIDFATVSGGACDSTYDVGNYDNTSANPSSPRAISGSANTCYKARIGSYNTDGVLNTVDYVYSGDDTTPPAQPVSLASSAADETSITWNFNDVTDATSYNVYRSSDDAYIGNSATSDYTQTTVTDGGAAISANAQYTVYARAVNANGTGIKSSTASAYTDANAPVNASHEGASQTETVMKWTWESGGAQKEYYASMTSPSGNTGWFTSLFWTVSSGLTTNSSYGFEVKARNQEDTETSSVSANVYTAQGTPSGVSFSSVGTDTITVTADGTFANLTSGSSGIRFQNTTSSADNTFQSADWTNSSLDPNTQYSYTVSAKNGDGDETSTATAAKYTLANVPGTPTIDGNTTSTLDVTVAVNSNPAATEFLIQETGSGEYVQIDGTLGAGEIWQIVGTGAGEWGNTTTTSGKVQVSGLAIDISYTFKVKTRNGESVETAYGSTSSGTTSIEDGTAPTLSDEVQTTMDLLIDQGANPASVTYKLSETSTSEFVQIDGSLGDTEVWQTAVEWGTESGTDGLITVTGLTAGTEYLFTVTPKSSGGTEGAESTATTLSTAAVPVEETEDTGSPTFFAIVSRAASSRAESVDDTGLDGNFVDVGVEVEIEVQEFLEYFEVFEFAEAVGDEIGFSADSNVVTESTRITSDHGISLSIYGGTYVSIDGSDTFTGSISAPVEDDSLIGGSGLDIVYALRIDTSSDESVYFSQSVLISMPAENVAGYDPENLYVYYYDADQGDYNYNSRLVFDSDVDVVAFMASHLTSFVIVYIDNGEDVQILGDYSVFPDVDGHWAESYVTKLYEMGAVSGKMIGKFAPNDEITRAEFVKIVLFALDYEIKEYDEASFTDLNKDHWAFDIVETATDLEILNGYEGGTVEPDEPVTRAEALVIIFSAMNESVYGPRIPDADFSDVNRDKWYAYHIDFAVHMGIVQGYDDGTFQPNENVLRGETAKMIIEAQNSLLNQ